MPALVAALISGTVAGLILGIIYPYFDSWRDRILTTLFFLFVFNPCFAALLTATVMGWHHLTT